MRVVIDTSSLLALVRYYLPFDEDDKLKELIKAKVESGQIIILDKVHIESKRVAKSIIIEKLEFLNNKDLHYKTDSLLPNRKFFNQLENSLCYGSQKKRLSEVEFEKMKDEFLETADAKLILYCIKDNNSLGLDKPILITEETKSENDNKLFKKLPEICSILEIECSNLPHLIKEILGINNVILNN